MVCSAAESTSQSCSLMIGWVSQQSASRVPASATVFGLLGVQYTILGAYRLEVSIMGDANWFSSLGSLVVF